MECDQGFDRCFFLFFVYISKWHVHLFITDQEVDSKGASTVNLCNKKHFQELISFNLS